MICKYTYYTVNQRHCAQYINTATTSLTTQSGTILCYTQNSNVASAVVTFASASSSSIKMMHGAHCSPRLNRSLTRAAPLPTSISTKSLALHDINGTFASHATARASSVLPVYVRSSVYKTSCCQLCSAFL
jgi:hypothetical protein